MSLIDSLFGTPEQNTRLIISHILLGLFIIAIFAILGFGGFIGSEPKKGIIGTAISTSFWWILFLVLAMIIGIILRRIFYRK